MSEEQPKNLPPIGAASLDDFWTKTEIYLSNEERGDAAPRDSLKISAAALFGIDDPANVYVAKATQAGYRNQVWQGQAISRSNDVMILVDKTGNEDGIELPSKSAFAFI